MLMKLTPYALCLVTLMVYPALQCFSVGYYFCYSSKKMLVFVLVLQYFLIVTGEQYKRDS